MEISEINKTKKNDIYQIDPRCIVVVDGFNSRVNFDLATLKEQIREHGVLNPISVIPCKGDDGYERYKLVDGERRYRATMELINEGIDIKRVPALFLPRQMSEVDKLTQQILRNEGKPFNEYEMAIACKKYVNYGYTQADIAKTLGKNAGQISYYLQHLDRDQRVQDLMRQGVIEGPKVREIYKGHEKEEDAVAEILGAAKAAKENGNGKITLKDIDPNSRTIAMKDTADIRKGLNKLFALIAKYTDNNTLKLDVRLTDIFAEIKTNSKVTVEEILKKKHDEAVKRKEEEEKKKEGYGEAV